MYRPSKKTGNGRLVENNACLVRNCLKKTTEPPVGTRNMGREISSSLGPLTRSVLHERYTSVTRALTCEGSSNMR